MMSISRNSSAAFSFRVFFSSAIRSPPCSNYAVKRHRKAGAWRNSYHSERRRRARPGSILATAKGMLDERKKSWRVIKRAAPGERFQKLHRAQETSGPSRILVTTVGIVLLAGGVVLLLIPGPGIPLIAFGAALVAQQSLWLAKRLDRLEPVPRRYARKAKSFWKKAATPIKAAIVSGAVLGAAATLYVAYLWLLRE